MKARIQRLLGAVTVVLTATAMLAGTAQADRPDDKAGMLGVGSTSVQQASPDAFERAVMRKRGTLGIAIGTKTAIPDAFERAVSRSLGASSVPDAFERAVFRASSVAVRPDDRAGVRGPGIVPSTSPAPSTAGGSDGFAWSEAAFGAGFTLGLVLLGGAAAVVIRQRRGAILH
jgi:hypothetical protein